MMDQILDSRCWNWRFNTSRIHLILNYKVQVRKITLLLVIWLVEIYYDNSKKVETTSGGLNVTGITTFSDRINVVSGVSTFQDDAKLTFGGILP